MESLSMKQTPYFTIDIGRAFKHLTNRKEASLLCQLLWKLRVPWVNKTSSMSIHVQAREGRMEKQAVVGWCGQAVVEEVLDGLRTCGRGTKPSHKLRWGRWDSKGKISYQMSSGVERMFQTKQVSLWSQMETISEESLNIYLQYRRQRSRITEDEAEDISKDESTILGSLNFIMRELGNHWKRANAGMWPDKKCFKRILWWTCQEWKENEWMQGDHWEARAVWCVEERQD